MYPLSRIGQDVVIAAVLLLTCLGIGQPAWAAPVPPSVDTPIGDFTVNEDASPNTFDLQNVFRDGIGPYTYAVVSNTDPSVVDATLSGPGGQTLTLTYLPNANGAAKITVEVTDFLLMTASDTFTVTVDPVNDDPAASSQVVATTEDTPRALTLVATDIDGDTLTYAIVTPPAKGTLAGSAPNLTYTPDADYTGPDVFRFNVNDGTTDSPDATVSITVTSVNDAPVASAQTVTAVEDATTGITLTGTDADGDVLTFVVATPPTQGALTGTAPNLTYTPAANYNGADSFVFHANDGTVNSAAVTVTINVSAINDGPIATAQAVSTAEDASQAITLAGTDIDGDPLTFIVGTAPSHGTLTGTAPNLTYTPAANYNGPDSFAFRTNDGTLNSSDATVTISVTSVNDAPTVGVLPPVTIIAEDAGPTPINLAGMFVDADGEALTLSVASTTGTVFAGLPTMAGTTLTVTFGANRNGPGSVTVTATDGSGASVTAPVQVSVTPVNDAPTVGAPLADLNVAEDSAPGNVALGGVFADPDIVSDGDSLTYSLANNDNAALVTASVAGSNLTLTYAPNGNGVANITIRATDQAAASIVDTFQVTVSVGNDAPVLVASPPPTTVAEDTASTSVNLAAMFTDPDFAHEGDVLTLSVAGATNGSLFSSPPTVSGNTLTLNFAADRNGASTVTVSATDSAGASVSGPVDVSVTPVNDDPTVVSPLPDITRNEDSPDDVIALGTVFGDVDVATNGDALTYSIVSNDDPTVVGSSIAGATLTLVYTPNANGVAHLTIQARDQAGQTATDSFTVTVDAVDDVPVANNDTATMSEDGGSVDIDVLANDLHGDDPTTVTAAGATVTIAGVAYPDSSESPPTTILDQTGTDITLPNGGLVINGPIVTYTPKADFNGSDFFTYTIQDADGQTATGRVDITINPVNDAPTQAGSQTYSVVQASVLTVIPSGGIVSQGYDADQDTLTIVQDTVPSSIGNGYPGTTLTTAADGSFTYTPDVTFVGTDTFVIRLTDGVTFSAPITVTVQVTAAPPPPPPGPAGEVEFDLKLANVPLEDAISAEANVLIVMDDSGSMDWGVMTDGPEGEFWITNAGIKASNTVPTFTREYQYLVPLPTNVYGNRQILPTEEALAGDAAFNGNNYGVWRGWNSQYNTVYYDPTIQYKPWVGLNRNNVDFTNSPPTAAPLDPYESPIRTIDLTTPITYVSNNVPVISGTAVNGRKNVSNNSVLIPRYYTTTVTGRPAWDAPHTLVTICAPASASCPATYVGGPNRADCAVDDADPATCTYTQEIQNYANWFTYYRIREYMAKAALGRAVADVSNVRLAYVVLNDGNERTKIASMNASYRVGNKKAMMNQIYKIDSQNGTPLRAALDRAGRYFECRSGDSFGSSANTAPGNTNCPVLPSPQGQCQNNFALLFSDGTWNETFSTGSNGNAARNNDGDCNTQFDCGKYKDAIAATLADVAMYYYERDLHPGLMNGVATTSRDALGAPNGAFGGTGEFMHQHMKTFTVGIGLIGLLNPASIPAAYGTPFAWGDPFNDGATAKVDDMLHAAVNGRGQALQANDPVLLSQALQSAFQEFTNGSVSVSAVAFNSTALREQTVEYRGFFNLKYNTGDLRALDVDPTTGFVNDASPLWRAAQKLDTQTPTNRVIFTYDRIVDAGIPFRFANLNANQKLVLDANELNWVRGDRSLEEPAGTFRQRPLVEGLLGDIVHSAPQFLGTPRGIRRDQAPFPLTKLYSAFADAQASRTPLVYVAANDGMLHGFDANLGTEKMAYVPNKLIDGSQRFKNQLDLLTSLSYSHRFFVDLTPTVEDVYMPPKKSSISKDWTSVLIGGLGGGGKGYYALNVSEPATDFSSEANASSTVLWEFTDKDDTYPVDSAGVPLGGAVGAITDLGGDPIKDLGYTYSQAQVFMSNLNDGGTPVQKKWVAIFGNGYNSTAGFAKLFVVPIEDGLNGWQAGDVHKLDTGEGVRVAPDLLAGYPNGLGTPVIVDVDLNQTADLAYAGDTFGNLYRFNISNSDPNLWRVTKLFQATYTSGTTTRRQPITTQPTVIKNPAGGFVIIFGTGSYVTDTDGVSTEIQSTYGIWDRGEINPATANSNTKATRLVQQVVTNVVDESNPLFDHLRIVSANPVDYEPQVGANPGVYGWYFDLVMQRPSLTLQGNANPDIEGNAPPAVQYPGERAIRRFVPRGSALLVTTVIPRDANTCLRSPPGSTFPIDALTGGNPNSAILDLNNDGIIDSNDFVTVGGVQYAAGILFDTSDLNGQLVDPSLLLGSGDADFLFMSGGDEQLTIRVAGPEDAKTGRLSWRELEGAN
jgi:type IV pilus assembly protein PilY1